MPGFIRQLAHVNAVRILVPCAWIALHPGWRSTSEGLPDTLMQADVILRVKFLSETTICLRDSGWEMVENCARYTNKDPSALGPLEARVAISVFS